MSPTEPQSEQRPELARITPPTTVSAEPDLATALESGSLANERLKAELAGLKQDTEERKKYAGLFFALSCAWIAIITVILLLQGFGSFWFGEFPFKLSEPIVLMAIGTTTVNIIGILFVVANYLFPKKASSDKPDKT